MESIPNVQPGSVKEWRKWLEKNHDREKSVWLIYLKKGKGESISYSDAVDQALCFGWIDSKALTIDADRYKQYFTVRKPNSVWSKVNKAKIAALIASKQMAGAGLAAVELAKKNGSWNVLDAVEALIIPTDLDIAFSAYPGSKDFFLECSRTDKRNILQWLVLAKKETTRAKRIQEIVLLANQGKKPKQFGT